MEYSILKSKKHLSKNLELVVIRKEDIQKIRKWRNEQREVLRQDKILTKKEQEDYFNKIIMTTFEKKNPEIYKYAPLIELSQQELLDALLKYQQMWNKKSWENKIEKKMAKATKKLTETQIQTLSEYIVTLKK